jgi:hypothetical protein
VKVFGDPPRTAEIVFDGTWGVTAVGVVPVLCFVGVAVVPVLCVGVVPVLCFVGVGEIVDDETLPSPYLDKSRDKSYSTFRSYNNMQ